ncbi:conserved Plasmodium protein, unknown function [Plasmodium vinckei vinckei]|uniref:PUB domain-containing protein n=1 Tax=Plasmodium vinckei vinckei TaxID=54757 RepID=A0A449BZX5_PLAVN|nr:conserved Plasmodium protein, unknown function [Plasmodium vinckei vinckei]KEG04182.1 hypothetical protein YYE_01085 [Plasmodium vinckei vinckei]VEV59015.1 conserved Plasmodium protein, unknown function [Plasmodium vinckei vinckei]
MDTKEIEESAIGYAEKKVSHNMEKREDLNENANEKTAHITGKQMKEVLDTFSKSEKNENLINMPISTVNKKKTNCDDGSIRGNDFCHNTEKGISTNVLKLKRGKSTEENKTNIPKPSTVTTSINMNSSGYSNDEIVSNEEAGEKCETLLELISKKSLLENDKIKKNISSKNFYIIDEDMLANIIIIFDKIISKLIYFYKKNNFDSDKQIEHFHNFFKVLYKLLSNISYYPKDEKYKIIKMCNNQIKKTFLTSDDIFNLVKLLFEILNFNTNYFNSDTEIGNKKNQENPIKTDNNKDSSDNNKDSSNNNKDGSNNNIDNEIWKFENEFSDVESILFEFVLSTINIIMGMINKKIHSSNNENEIKSNKKSDADIKGGYNRDPIKSSISNHNSNKILNNEAKNKLIEKHVNNIMSTNHKLLGIRQKDIAEKNALNDIRKLHNEKFNAYRNNDGYKDKNDKKKSSLFSNKYDHEKNSIKKGGKKIKSFFKNLFKKD